MFSRRLAWPPRENRLAALLREKRAAGRALLDLTESNPTRVGLSYPAAGIAAALADPGVAAYDPDPRGLRATREAVAAWCGRRGLAVSADRMVLTCSTSEAYAILFKLLADPGDVVLVPQPGYPLFDELAALESIRPVPYPIVLEDAWRIDLETLDRLLTPPAAEGGAAQGPATPRAVIVVNPNNPTGSALRPAERDRIDALAARAGAAVIADEVFLDFLLDGGPGVSMAGPRAAGLPAALTFTLGGLSKACGLPQMKLGWILIDGPEDRRSEALARLEFIADSYLSAGTPVQLAAGRLLALGDGIASLIRERVAANRGLLVAAFPEASGCRVLPSDGGWYAVLQVPAIRSEEELVLDLLASADVLVHPGYFFDFPREAFLILSLLPEPGRFGEALRRIRARLSG
ncbi:MAG TPA: pyridoxal phosphate-dependent aminotransferase [Patescibacteria group bacterium]|nr:pyridoxal phosphate-dependent aminotransferase [Patescibacteria group bacterium]